MTVHSSTSGLQGANSTLKVKPHPKQLKVRHLRKEAAVRVVEAMPEVWREKKFVSLGGLGSSPIGASNMTSILALLRQMQVPWYVGDYFRRHMSSNMTNS